MPSTEFHADVRLGANGRLVVPATLRRVLGLRPGEALIARIEDERLVVEKAAAVERRLHEYFRKFEGRSLADELMAERREEAAREGRS